MELFKVKIMYRESLREPAELPGMPYYKEVETYAAVHGAFMAEMVRQAGEAAIRGVIGENVDVDKWQPVVTYVEQLGSVHLQRD